MQAYNAYKGHSLPLLKNNDIQITVEWYKKIHYSLIRFSVAISIPIDNFFSLFSSSK